MSSANRVDPDHHVLSELTSPVEILLDRWGIPHIYAATASDAFFAQGFNAARERLWQIDLWRRRGLGLLAEAFGADYLERDLAARLFRYRGSMEAEWGAYDPIVRVACEQFTAGINAYVERALSTPGMLAAEFQQLGYLPALWEPADVLKVRSNGRHHNAGNELARALVLREFGERVERLRLRLEPDRPIAIPPGLDLAAITPDVLRLYQLATAPFEVGATGEIETVATASLWGSNNWAIAGSKTASGRPILANDPHRAMTFPSIRYMVHLSAPGLEMIGAGEPAVPGVAIGHNGTLAFGVTTFCGDQEDLYTYETNATGSAYRYDGHWEPFQVVHESVPVRDAGSEEIELRFTRHGPVVAATDSGTAFAVRAAWLEPGMAPYLGALGCLMASDWREFSATAERWGYPGDNLVYADTQGAIAWKPVGRFPIRRGWDGLLPVPGDGRYEWEGNHDPAVLGGTVDPAAGWLASANERNLDDATLERLNLGYEWLPNLRHARIAEVLGAARDATIADSVALQCDYVSPLAVQVLGCLDGYRPADPDLAWAVSELDSWDRSLEASSCAAALFEVWFRLYLAPGLLRAALEQLLAPEDVERALQTLIPPGRIPVEPRPILEILSSPAEHLGPEPERMLEDIVGSTLKSAVAHLEALLGPERGAWSWGRLHRVELAHPAAAWLGGLDPSIIRTQPAGRGGSTDTVGNTAYALADFAQTDGCSWRMVLDVGGWDASVAVNYPGQSGHLGDPHQADLSETWVADGSVPLLFSRSAVQSATARRIVLMPRDRQP